MNYRDIIILLPVHGVEDLPSDLSDEKAAGLLNAFAVAWHPQVLVGSESLPREHRADDPPTAVAGSLILIPTASEETLPAGWIEQARSDGAVVVAGVSERGALTEAVLQPLDDSRSVHADVVSDFFALGTGRLMTELLSRRMHHFEGFDDGRLRREAVAAAEAALAGNLEEARTRLKNCFETLTETRERFYPVEFYLIDLCLLIPRLAGVQLEHTLASPKPLNVLLTGADLETISREHPAVIEQFREALSAGRLEVVGGEWTQRPVPLVPLTSFLRELELGRTAFWRILEKWPLIWGRRRYGFTTLLPMVLDRFGFRGALHVTLDDGLFPDTEESRVRWEGCDGTAIDATTRIPLAADGAASYLRFPSRLAESMQQDQTAAIIWARWPDVRNPFWQDLERIHSYSAVLGRFVTLRQFFEQSEDSGRHSRFQETEYLSPFLIQVVAAEEPDPVSRFRRHFVRRSKFDAAMAYDSLTAILEGRPPGHATPQLLEQVEAAGPDLPGKSDAPSAEVASQADVDERINTFLEESARGLGGKFLTSGGTEPGYLILNSLSFDRTVTVDLPKLETPPPLQLPIRGIQSTGTHCRATVDVPACGYVWIRSRNSKPERARSAKAVMAEDRMIRNEFIEVHINEATGGIARIKEFGRKPNRLSQQLALRFPRERTIAGSNDETAERTFYSQMRCTSIVVTSSGPALGEIVTAGSLIDPQDGSTVAEFDQTVRVWRGRRIIELEIELRSLKLPDGDPWSNYFTSRFAWNDSAATLTRSVLGGAHSLQSDRFESPHFLEIATESQRITILNGGLPFHRKTGPRMVDSLLIVAGETERRFRFGLAIDVDYPMQAAMDFLVPATVLETSEGPPLAGNSGWLFHLSAKNVQILQFLPLRRLETAVAAEADFRLEGFDPASNETDDFGFIVRLVETEGRHRPVKLECYRTPTRAKRIDFCGRSMGELAIADEAVLIEMSAYEIVDVELRFGSPR
jgi:alpha-mannosidase